MCTSVQTSRWLVINPDYINQFLTPHGPYKGAYDCSSGHGSQKKRRSELGKAAPIFSSSRGNRVRRCSSPLGSHEGNPQQLKSAAFTALAQVKASGASTTRKGRTKAIIFTALSWGL